MDYRGSDVREVQTICEYIIPNYILKHKARNKTIRNRMCLNIHPSGSTEAGPTGGTVAGLVPSNAVPVLGTHSVEHRRISQL
jgi:hypothetical protein